MIVFLIIYILSFFISLVGVLRGNTDKIFLFIIFGLPLYFTSLSIAYSYGFKSLVPTLQSFKEIIIVITLGVLLYQRKTMIRFHLLDWLTLTYFIYTFLYVLVPLGNLSFTNKLLAFKSLSFFPLIYFTGRFLDFRKIDFNRYFSFICVVSILAGCVLVVELIRYEHLQTYTGYAEFNQHFLNQSPSGHYGITWTFETPMGLKRFASFYGHPLELGVNTILTTSILIALSTKNSNKFIADKLQQITLLFTLFAIFMALSRAAFVNYFFTIYVYAIITNKSKLINLFHYGAIGIVVVVLLWLRGDIYTWLITTLDFSDSSSAFHVLQWMEGIQAIGSNLLGMGLGTSGRVAAATDSNIGGENQFIIIGVQVGVIAIALYLAIYIYTLRTCIKLFNNSQGKARIPALALFMLKTGVLIPMFTANTESYIYLSYFSWLLTGIVVNIEMEHVPYNTRSLPKSAEQTHRNIKLFYHKLRRYCVERKRYIL